MSLTETARFLDPSAVTRLRRALRPHIVADHHPEADAYWVGRELWCVSWTHEWRLPDEAVTVSFGMCTRDPALAGLVATFDAAVARVQATSDRADVPDVLAAKARHERRLADTLSAEPVGYLLHWLGALPHVASQVIESHATRVDVRHH